MNTFLRSALFVLLLALPTRVAATVPADLCTGDPCIISASASIDDSSNLDFGATTDVIVAEDVILTVNGSSPSVDFSGASIVFEPGATLRSTGTIDQGLDLYIAAQDGNLELRASGTKKARLDLDGPSTGQGGTIYATATGNILFDGIVEGRGSYIPELPSLPLALPAKAQIQSSSGACWEATFDAAGATKNDATQFSAKAGG